MNFVFVVVTCAVQAIADDAHHRSLMRRKVSDADLGAMSLTISDFDGIRGSKDEIFGDRARASQGAQLVHARREYLNKIFNRVHHRFHDVVNSDAFLEADHETFFAAVEGVRNLMDMKMTSSAGVGGGNSVESHRGKTKWGISSKSKSAHDKDADKESDEKKKDYCKWVTKDEKNKDEDEKDDVEKHKDEKEKHKKGGTCRPNLDYEYGPMDDPMLFNSYADAQECWRHDVQATCFGRGCAWRGGECHYAIPNTTSHGLLVKYMPSVDCGWFAKLERPRKCQTYSLDECPMDMEPCTNGTAYVHNGEDEYCGPVEVCDSDKDKAMDFLCEEPLHEIYVKCFTETKDYTGAKQQAKEIACIDKECPDFAAMMEFNYKAAKLCPRYHGELEPCERQSNCSYDEAKSKCVPDSSTMMLDRVPKSCRYYDRFKKKKQCTTTLASRCTNDDCEWIESTPCTGNDTVPKFECDVKSNVYLRTVIDNTDDEHLLTFVQAVTAKEICLASLHEDSCKKATPMQRNGHRGASSRPAVGALYKVLAVAIISFGSFASLFS